ncbi:unnamed protein product [Lasius platythorax]|uniref:Uncharacterized protein n=1 Tax=Lasius platythorax TaxID=488582 RepID=A0AAV2N269_9HYME
MLDEQWRSAICGKQSARGKICLAEFLYGYSTRMLATLFRSFETNVENIPSSPNPSFLIAFGEIPEETARDSLAKGREIVGGDIGHTEEPDAAIFFREEDAFHEPFIRNIYSRTWN